MVAFRDVLLGPPVILIDSLDCCRDYKIMHENNFELWKHYISHGTYLTICRPCKVWLSCFCFSASCSPLSPLKFCSSPERQWTCRSNLRGKVRICRGREGVLERAHIPFFCRWKCSTRKCMPLSIMKRRMHLMQTMVHDFFLYAFFSLLLDIPLLKTKIFQAPYRMCHICYTLVSILH